MTEGEKLAENLPSRARKIRWAIFPVALAIAAWVFFRSKGQPALTFLAFVLPILYLWDEAWMIHKTLYSEEKMEVLKSIDEESEAKEFIFGRNRRMIKIMLVVALLLTVAIAYYATAL